MSIFHKIAVYKSRTTGEKTLISIQFLKKDFKHFLGAFSLFISGSFAIVSLLYFIIIKTPPIFAPKISEDAGSNVLFILLIITVGLLPINMLTTTVHSYIDCYRKDRADFIYKKLWNKTYQNFGICLKTNLFTLILFSGIDLFLLGFSIALQIIRMCFIYYSQIEKRDGISIKKRLTTIEI